MSLCKEHDAFNRYIEPVYSGYELNADWHKLLLNFIVPTDANPELESEYLERLRHKRSEDKKAKKEGVYIRKGQAAKLAKQKEK